MNTISVSTYSLREQLGRPMDFSLTDPSGKDVHISFPFTKTLEMSEFPARAKAEFGVDTIETTAFQFSGLDDPELDRFAEQLAANGVRLVNVAIDGGDLRETGPVQRAAHIGLLKQWIDRFAAMGSAFVRVDAGSPLTPHDGKEPPSHLVEALRELGTYATEKGARLLIENHGGPTTDPVWMNKLLDAVGKDRCGLLLDLGNFEAVLAPAMALFLSGDDRSANPEQVFDGVDLSPIYADINALAPRAEYVHVKAHHVTDDGVVGAVDLVRAIGILAAHGYGGPLSIEYEGTGGDPWAKTARVVEVAAAAARGVAR